MCSLLHFEAKYEVQSSSPPSRLLIHAPYISIRKYSLPPTDPLSLLPSPLHLPLEAAWTERRVSQARDRLRRRRRRSRLFSIFSSVPLCWNISAVDNSGIESTYSTNRVQVLRSCLYEVRETRMTGKTQARIDYKLCPYSVLP